MASSPESTERVAAPDASSPCDVMVEPTEPTKPTETLKRSHAVAFNEDDVNETLEHYLHRAFDNLEDADGLTVSLQRILELTRAQCNSVLWRGMGGPPSTSTIAGCRWAMCCSDGIFFQAVNRVAEERFGVRLRRFKGKKAQKAPPGSARWHLPNVTERE